MEQETEPMNAKTKQSKRPPFRAEHVGSLKRPERLQRAREELLGEHSFDRNLGAHDNAELREIEDEAIRDVIALQEGVGLHTITDGEFRRRTWWTDFTLGLDGFEENTGGKPALIFKDKSGHERPIPSIVLRGRVGRSKSAVDKAFAFLQANTRETAKLTIPAPTGLHYFIGGTPVVSKVYDDLEPFWDDLVAAYRAEIAYLYEQGCRYLQLDEVAIAFLCDESRCDEVRSWGHEPDALLGTYIDLMRRTVEGHPDDLTLAMHMCRGNASAHWGSAGGYEPVAERLFSQVPVDAFFLEYDTERAGGFEPLRFLPKGGPSVVLGLVTTKSPELETADGLTRRIEDAAQYAPLDQLCLSPQCGFASNYVGNPVTIDDEKRKLELIVQVASDVWGEA
jgi:5-methyltetrahydropteroyltriglutamate--homocysteine methyltransferase